MADNILETGQQSASRDILPRRKPNGRPKTKHGGYAYLARGKVSEPRKHHIQLYLDAARQGLIDDLTGGQGEAALPAAKLILIDRSLALLGVLRLIEEYIAEKGVFQESGELMAPLGSSYIAYQNTLRQTLALLGINRKVGKGDDLEGYLKRKYPAVYNPAQLKVKSAAGPAKVIESVKPSSKQAWEKLSGVSSQSGGDDIAGMDTPEG